MIYFVLGEYGDTGIRHLRDPNRSTFKKSNVDMFILTTEEKLGELLCIRIGHDNSGGGWYLRLV